jgi:hypothetical protein
VRFTSRSFNIAQRIYLSGNLNDCNLLAIHKIDGIFFVKINLPEFAIYLFKAIIPGYWHDFLTACTPFIADPVKYLWELAARLKS